ncbi:hypothetical protein PGT21_023524 [Puccinia graminis f. sp. tritici]|uniref:Uncharacterized protein n=1 Tax=Puccinia graminis f. sp. tritici TaxID=56615 RepID=A0A5B0N9A4_PUCGR|nr:hypothetical protein PGT21_023524 [Puccinia graminis f. sp. tritici]
MHVCLCSRSGTSFLPNSTSGLDSGTTGMTCDFVNSSLSQFCPDSTDSFIHLASLRSPSGTGPVLALGWFDSGTARSTAESVTTHPTRPRPCLIHRAILILNSIAPPILTRTLSSFDLGSWTSDNP